MLFRQRFLDGIASGTITLAFRRWDRPRVRQGTLMRTRIGLIGVDSVEMVSADSLTDDEARAAGYSAVAELIDDLDNRGSGAIYRIAVRLRGPDPRIALRADADLDQATIRMLCRRLERMDLARAGGPWTLPVLRLIRDKPGTRAPDLAAETGREIRPFKADVRKLKELGLTESLEIGYRLSPRGEAFLQAIDTSDGT
jgi:hypothetical protein